MGTGSARNGLPEVRGGLPEGEGGLPESKVGIRGRGRASEAGAGPVSMKKGAP